MNKKKFFLFLVLCNSLLFYGQNIPPAPADKAVVYFIRPNALGFGSAINFSFLDSTRLIGKLNGTNYIRYECEPGKHLFWARSENRDFVESEVEAGKIYFMEAFVQMGAIKAGVKLNPVDPMDKKRMEKIKKLLNKKPAISFSEEELEKQTENFQEVIGRGLEKYKEEKENGKIHARLEKYMFYNHD